MNHQDVTELVFKQNKCLEKAISYRINCCLKLFQEGKKLKKFIMVLFNLSSHIFTSLSKTSKIKSQQLKTWFTWRKADLETDNNSSLRAAQTVQGLEGHKTIMDGKLHSELMESAVKQCTLRLDRQKPNQHRHKVQDTQLVLQHLPFTASTVTNTLRSERTQHKHNNNNTKLWKTF